MRVLLFCPFSLPNTSAASIRIINIAKMLQAKKCDVEVFGINYDNNDSEGCYEGINYNMLNIKTKNSYCYRKKEIKSSIENMLNKLTKKGHIDTIILTGIYVDFFNIFLKYSKKYKTPIIINSSEWFGFDDVSFKGIYGKVKLIKNRVALKFLYPKTKNIIAISSLIDKYYKNHKCNTIIIPTIVDMNNYKNVNHKKSKKIKIVYAGNPRKKDYIINVIKALLMMDETSRNRFELHLYGANKEEISKLGVLPKDFKTLKKVLFCHGSIPFEKVKSIVTDADYTILLRPNKKYANAGFPTKVGESMACGTPVIANITSDLDKYIIDNNNGIICNDEKPESCMNALLKTLKISESSYFSMRENAFITAQKYFSYNIYKDKLYYMINNAIKITNRRRKYMKKKIATEFKSAAAYMISVIFSRGIAIITIPIFTRLMTTEQVGIVNLYNSWQGLLSVIASLALTSGGFSIAMKEFEKDRDSYVSSVLVLTSFFSLVFLIVYCLNVNFWNNITGLSTKLMLLMIISFILTPAMEFWLAKQRYEYKYKLSTIITISSAILASAFSIIMVLKSNNNLGEVRLISNYFIIFIFDFLIWIYILKKGIKGFNKKYLVFSLKLSIPLIGYTICAQILNVSDRVMISKMIGNSEVGIYSILYTVSSLSLMIWFAINASFVPYLYQNINKNNDNIKKISLYILKGYSLLAFLLVLLAPEIVKILATGEYYSAIYIMPPIAAGVYYISLSNFYSNILIYMKKTKYIMYASFSAAILNIILNLIFIKKIGFMSAAYTTFVSYLLQTVLLFIFTNKVYSNIGDINDIYNNKYILIMSIIVNVILLSGLLLYRISVIRYVIIIVLIAFSIIYLLKLRKNISI